MSYPALPAIALLMLAPAASAERPRAETLDGVEFAQLTIHQRIIIRIPRTIVTRPPKPPRLVQKKGPKCVDMAEINRAIINGSESIDLITEEGERIRARFEGGCPALDFYPDLYLKPTSDGKICARRDAVRSRSGSVCPIANFTTIELKPDP